MSSSPPSAPSSLILPHPRIFLKDIDAVIARRAMDAKQRFFLENIEASKEACAESLIEFVRQAWHVIEPGNAFVDGWALQAICEHLEAITYGDLTRLLINVPPGMSKSTLTAVMWPAWEWGPCNLPTLRYIATSHSLSFAIRDTMKMRRLILSEWYQQRWGESVNLTRDQNAKTKFENTATGFREAMAFNSLTGSRGDRVMIDDPHSVEGARSDAERGTTINNFLESVPTRLNNPSESAISIIMQRLHEEDVSGVAISKELGYEHLMLPMEFERDRKCVTSIGFEDPRSEDGELLFPERFPREVVERDKVPLGVFGVAGQFQQRPEPRGGGILKRADWLLWDDEEAAIHGVPNGAFPAFEFVLASVDTAYTEKQENDPSALTIWGVWKDRHGNRKLMLCAAWQERYDVNRLVNEVAKSCKRLKVQKILIEAKAAGHSVAQEIRRLYADATWSVQLIDPGNKSKVARAYAVQPLFEAGLVYAPDRTWAEMTIAQCATFPRGKHDDLVDTVTMAVHHLRQIGMAELASEREAVVEAQLLNWKQPEPLY